MFFKKKEEVKVNEVDNIIAVANEEPEKQYSEEWIWVEGYKGTDENMKCKDFQYELNYHYKYGDNIELCSKGFHFCTKLQNVFSYYNLNIPRINRYFKVKGLVKKTDYENVNKEKNFIYSGWNNDSKIVAKEIIFLEELKFNDLKEYITNYYPFIETEEEYYNCNDYDDFCKSKFISEMVKSGFSELYSYIKYTKLEDHRSLQIFLQRARAYQAEGIGKDIMIYLLETFE